jgi:hypothetical protein
LEQPVLKMEDEEAEEEAETIFRAKKSVEVKFFHES